MISDAAKCFWQEFDASSEVLAENVIGGRHREAFQHIETLLQKNGFDFCFELTCEGPDAVLALTPEGNVEVAQRIENLVQAKPDIRGWRVYSHRQRKPLSDALTFVRHIYGIDVADASFDLQLNFGLYRITMYCGDLNELTTGEICGLVETLLDHAIGEELVMSKVEEVSGRAFGRGQLSLSELVQRLTVDRTE
jgi:hypothetical protein